jgi:hypothetical protein
MEEKKSPGEAGQVNSHCRIMAEYAFSLLNDNIESIRNVQDWAAAAG